MSLKDIFESIGNFFSSIWNYEFDGINIRIKDSSQIICTRG